MTDIIELSDKDLKTDRINTFKDVKEYKNLMRRKLETIK